MIDELAGYYTDYSLAKLMRYINICPFREHYIHVTNLITV